ncbi:MAG: MarR family winged helix-turn-helix transcriptional regulator [Acidobacteriota bacterium]
MKLEIEAVLNLYPRIYLACHTRHVRDPLTKALLTAHQASILDHLDEEDPIALFDLAGHLGVTVSTMSLNINRLVQLGYVSRVRSESDARRLELRLTDAGVRIKRAQSVLDPARVGAVLKRLGSAERKAAIRGLGLLADAATREMQNAHPAVAPAKPKTS